MIAQLSTLARTRYPFNWRFLGYGAAIGVSQGLMRLFLMGESVDLATAVGIASFVSVTVGLWLGTELAGWYLKYTGWQIAAMRARLDALQAGETAPLEQEAQTEHPRSHSLWGWCLVDLPLLLLGMGPIAVLYALLESQVRLNDFHFWNSLAVSLGVVIVAVFVVHRVYFWRIGYQICCMEETKGVEIPLSRLAQQTRHWQRRVRTLPKWVERITGPSISQFGQGRSEEFPGTAA